jgi:prephenate dehydratase
MFRYIPYWRHCRKYPKYQRYVPYTYESDVDNTTRFFVLSARSSPSSNSSRVFLRFMVDHTQPGALCDVLQAFKHYNLNLTSIVSRPAVEVGRLWTYVFFVEFEGHEEDQSAQKVVAEMRTIARELRVLGSYETHPQR